ncbi:LysM domain-containing protein [Fontibacillus phaseoli]|uniref:LysM domain-containing protein n=1 Tax=Fontibacillus phaseoli TaxID=1416533 RepID=A0A369BSL4_9BACL|nr:LysM peptidoglycan-binding domain-containing protein [Fontibacillus phaseoli]RCX22594.1 LysM domain-containing protein [Fontibacillus phaseoli]
MSEYSLTLSVNQDAEEILLPVLPEKIEFSESGNGKTYEISGLGEINVIKNMKLMEISFEGLLPASWFPGANVPRNKTWFSPSHYLITIQKWRRRKLPVKLVVNLSGMEISLHVSIEKFTWSESGGAVGDIQYQISLKEYRPYSAKKVQVSEPDKQQAGGTGNTAPANTANSAPPRPDTRIPPKTYTLVAGDSLWKVAKRFLGDGSKYKQIQSLNGIKDSELKKLPVGKVIKLP